LTPIPSDLKVMEFEAQTVDDEVLLEDRSRSGLLKKRILLGVGAAATVAIAGQGGRAAWNSSYLGDAISLYSHHRHHHYDGFYPSSDSQWHDYVRGYTRFDVSGCSFDGEDCSLSRCCARQGSQCYRKNAWFASCNETCLPFSKWEGHHGHGRWVHSSHPHWDCAVLPAVVPQAILAKEQQVDIPQGIDATIVEQPKTPAREEVIVEQPKPLVAREEVPNYPRWFIPPREYWPESEYFKATVYGGCQEDGLDCRYARCCAREGSRCFVKNNQWASCNETCFPFTQWEGAHRHGRWRATHYPVWDCTDITTENNELA